MHIALDQDATVCASPAANLARLDQRARQAAAAGAHLLVAPELSLTGYDIGSETHRLAEGRTGPAGAEVARIAAEHGTAIAYGYPERDGEQVYNAVRVVDEDGREEAHYRKTHLFGQFERTWFTPGGTPLVQASLRGVRIGLLICYDVEFPEMVRAHALAGTELLVVPTALARPHEFVAETVVPARAFESQLYLAYVNRCGEENGTAYCGRSVLASPDGAEVVRAGAEPHLLTAEVDTAALARARANNTHLADRQPHHYVGVAPAPRP
ncbi:carbon-nitrogen hydrolase family protein [Salinifilum aidingensis]